MTRRHERRARARALQALYACEMRGDGNLSAAAARIFDDLAVEPREREMAAALVTAVSSDGATLDEHVTAVATNWRIERLGAIERSLLRLATAELGNGATPPRVVLQEAVRLAERFAGLESARFVNGVLDAIARRMGRL